MNSQFITQFLSSVFQTHYLLTGLDPYTNYSVIVQAIGSGGLVGLLTSDSEVIMRTHSNTPTIFPTPGATDADTSRRTILVYPPDPRTVDTGPVMYTFILCLKSK